jgi:hypothetical protein
MFASTDTCKSSRHELDFGGIAGSMLDDLSDPPGTCVVDVLVN